MGLMVFIISRSALYFLFLISTSDVGLMSFGISVSLFLGRCAVCRRCDRGVWRVVIVPPRTRTRINTLPMAVGTRGDWRHLSPKTSARACAVWCNAV